MICTSSDLACIAFSSVNAYVKSRIYGITSPEDNYLSDAKKAIAYRWIIDTECELSKALNCVIEKFCNEPEIKNLCCSDPVDPTCLGVIIFNCAAITIEDTTPVSCSAASISINVIV